MSKLWKENETLKQENAKLKKSVEFWGRGIDGSFYELLQLKKAHKSLRICFWTLCACILGTSIIRMIGNGWFQ